MMKAWQTEVHCARVCAKEQRLRLTELGVLSTYAVWEHDPRRQGESVSWVVTTHMGML